MGIAYQHDIRTPTREICCSSILVAKPNSIGVGSGGWRVEDGGRRMESGGWRAEDGSGEKENPVVLAWYLRADA